VSEPAIARSLRADWYAHRLDRRRKCLLVTHAETLFSVFMPNVTAAGLRPIGPPVVSAIQAALQAEGLPVDTLGDLDPQQVPWPRPPIAASWHHQRPSVHHRNTSSPPLAAWPAATSTRSTTACIAPSKQHHRLHPTDRPGHHQPSRSAGKNCPEGRCRFRSKNEPGRSDTGV